MCAMLTAFVPRWMVMLLVAILPIGAGCEPMQQAETMSPPVGSQNNHPGSAGAELQLAAVRNAAPSSDWSAFRGAGQMGVSPSNELPLRWSATENLAWKAPLPGAGASSPIVFGDRVYLTCYTGYFVPGEDGGRPDDLRRHLLSVRLADGEIIWNKAVPAKLPEEDRIRDHGFAASTPAADAEGVVVFFGKTGVLAFDHEGNEVWRADVGSGTNGWGSSASPLLHAGLVYINASVESGALVALDRATGEEKWRAGGIKEAWNTPVLVTAEGGREELVIAIAGKLLAFDPGTGDPLWTCDTDIAWYMVPSVVAAEGVIYSLGGRSGVTALAVRAGGSGDVTRSHRLWTSRKGSNVSSPVYRDGHLYYMNDQQGIAYCARAEDGEIVYEQRLERAGQVYASALLAGERIYYLTRDGRCFIVAASPRFEQLAVNELRDGGVFNGGPTPAGDRLLLRSDKFLYCVGD